MRPLQPQLRKLKLGELIRVEGTLYRVELVNACRARIRPLGTKHQVVKTWDGREVEFDAPLKPLDVSPRSVVEHLEG